MSGAQMILLMGVLVPLVLGMRVLSRWLFELRRERVIDSLTLARSLRRALDVELRKAEAREEDVRVGIRSTRERLAGVRPRVSISFALVGFAVRRLPSSMTEEEKERWAREMRADAASIPRGRFRRIRFAFNLWRKGAPQMPVGEEPAARPVRD